MDKEPSIPDRKDMNTMHLEEAHLQEDEVRSIDIPETNVASVYGIDEAHQKRVIRRVDLRLLPILGIMYSISLVDRLNLGLAYVAGMREDLELDVGTRYTIVVMVFFVAYIIFEIPSNMILPKAGAANWLAFLGVGFGSIMIGMGFTKNWATLAVCRALLGTMEAGFLPGCTYLITCWYTRFEVGKRLSAFWLISVVMNGCAAIFAYALTQLKGTHGINGWRWIFIIEGAITTGVCLIGRLIIIDFPTKAEGFLAPEEKEFIIARINNDRGDAEEDKPTLSKILHHLKDWKLYFWAFNLFASMLPAYALAYFKTIILEGMGFSTMLSQLLTAPPFIPGAAVALLSGWLSDKYHIRGPVIALHQLVTAVGMLVTAYGQSSGARYFGIFLGIGALQYCIPGILTFQANNIVSNSKRAVASATCLIGGGVGGIVAGVVFKSSESPQYPTGIWTTFAVSMVSVILTIIMDVYFWRANKRARASGRPLEGREGWYYTL